MFKKFLLIVAFVVALCMPSAMADEPSGVSKADLLKVCEKVLSTPVSDTTKAATLSSVLIASISETKDYSLLLGDWVKPFTSVENSTPWLLSAYIAADTKYGVEHGLKTSDLSTDKAGYEGAIEFYKANKKNIKASKEFKALLKMDSAQLDEYIASVYKR